MYVDSITYCASRPYTMTLPLFHTPATFVPSGRHRKKRSSRKTTVPCEALI